MYEVQEVIDLIENVAPPETAAKWDNSGWQINLSKKNFNKIMTALTVTDDVVKQAVDKGCDLIIAHHPLIFESLKKIDDIAIIRTIQNGIQIYSAHTNLDVAKGGTTDTLVEKCGFEEAPVIEDFINGKTLSEEIDLEFLKEDIKKRLNLDTLKVINLCDKKSVKSVAFCAGAGGSEISRVNDFGFDLFITGEVKFHEAFEAKDTVVFEVGHYDSEKYVGEIFKRILGEKFEILEADEKRPYDFN